MIKNFLQMTKFPGFQVAEFPIFLCHAFYTNWRLNAHFVVAGHKCDLSQALPPGPEEKKMFISQEPGRDRKMKISLQNCYIYNHYIFFSKTETFLSKWQNFPAARWWSYQDVPAVSIMGTLPDFI